MCKCILYRFKWYVWPADATRWVRGSQMSQRFILCGPWMSKKCHGEPSNITVWTKLLNQPAHKPTNIAILTASPLLWVEIVYIFQKIHVSRFERWCTVTTQKLRCAAIPLTWQELIMPFKKNTALHRRCFVTCHFIRSSGHYQLIVVSLLVSHIHTHRHTSQTYSTPPPCLFICLIISPCPKEQQQDIWCNTIAGSVPRGACRSLLLVHWSIQLSIIAYVQGSARSLQHLPRGTLRIRLMGCLYVQTTGFIPSLSILCTGESLSHLWFYTVEEWALSGDPSSPF